MLVSNDMNGTVLRRAEGYIWTVWRRGWLCFVDLFSVGFTGYC